jgi:hypothetical protein
MGRPGQVPRGCVIRGVVGTIKWAYYNAAAINGYRVTQTPDGQWHLRATVVPGLSDSFKLSQRPLRFVAPTEKGEWTWPIRELTIEHGTLRASLGPPEP